ncbi:MAG: putative membrane protein [Litorivivens sp.]|jgi:uncharacterized membrane protein
MDTESISKILIVVHAATGGLALLAGLLALIFKKGSTKHKRTGIIFYYSMLLSAVIALFVACMPNHESVFLFLIGLFSSYFILTGYRAVRFKLANPNLKIDKIIAYGMLITALGMILYPIIILGKLNIVLGVFGLVGGAFAINDLRKFKDLVVLKKNWIKMHLGKMLGGYISATTAFVVVNNVFPSFYGWFIPGVIGTFYIVYWQRKVSPKKA